MQRRVTLIPFVVALAALWTGGAYAQAVPDAGRLMRSSGRAEPEPVGSVSAPIRQEAVRLPPASQTTVRFRIERIRFSGNTLMPSSELESMVADVIAKDISLGDLKQAAARVTTLYHQKGYVVAHAYVPPQNIKDGVAEIAVFEGKLGAVSVKTAGEARVSDDHLRAIVAEQVPEGSLIRQADLERALLLMRDIAGVEARSTLRQGQLPGTSDILVEASGRPLMSGAVELDTFGEKFTGRDRLGGSLNLNSPLGIGDQASMRLVHTAYSDYGLLRYRLPLGVSGLVVGAMYSELSYQLCCEFSALQASGSATVKRLYGQYPLVRSPGLNVDAALSFDSKEFFNRTIAGTLSDYSDEMTTVSVAGNWRDGFAGGGVNQFAVALGMGFLDLDPFPANKAADAFGPKAHGNFTKLNFDLARSQSLGGPWTLFLLARGQWASKNLDSSEQMVLGGAYGVRAYPQGEAAGDQGVLTKLELRWAVSPMVQWVGFVDYGAIHQHTTTWTGWQGGNLRLPNSYALSAMGIGVNWMLPEQIALRASVATPLGSNPGRNVNGKDSDAAHHSARVWLQLAKSF